MTSLSLNLNEWINHNIVRCEVEGGVYLRDLPLGAEIEVPTRNRLEFPASF